MKEIKVKKYKGSFVLRLALIFGFVFLIAVIINLQVQIVDKKSQLQEVNAEIAEQTIVNDEIKFSLEEYENGQDELIENEARVEYDFAKIGERVFEIVGTN